MLREVFTKSGRAVAPRPPYPPTVGRRVPTPPFKRGVTLVELMISMLILTIVCIAWLQIIGIQSARKEARRREAVERLAGMMDAFLCRHKTEVPAEGNYRMKTSGSSVVEFGEDSKGTSIAHNVFADESSPIGYQLAVVSKASLPVQERFGDGWQPAIGSRLTGRWLVGRLYNGIGIVSDSDRAFFTLSVCLGL